MVIFPFFSFSALMLLVGWQGRHPTCKKYGGDGEVGTGYSGWSGAQPDGQCVTVSASVNLPLRHKVQKFSSGTGSPGWSQRTGRKTVVWWW